MRVYSGLGAWVVGRFVVGFGDGLVEVLTRVGDRVGEGVGAGLCDGLMVVVGADPPPRTPRVGAVVVAAGAASLLSLSPLLSKQRRTRFRKAVALQAAMAL